MPRHSPPENPSTKKIQMQKGTDEVNQGTTSYRVSLGPAEPEGVVNVPPEVAEHLIRQGGAVDIDPPPDPPKGFVHVRHVSNPNATVGWGEKVYTPDKDGKLHVPIASVEDIRPHGFIIC